MSELLDAKIKDKGLLDKYDICILAKISDWNTKLEILATKTELEVEEDKIAKFDDDDDDDDNDDDCLTKLLKLLLHLIIVLLPR